MDVRPGYKQTDVGVIPHDWDCMLICDLARLESGHTPSRTINAYWHGDIPWVSLHDTASLDRNYIYHTAMTVTQLGIDNSSARLLPAGTVVFSRTATVGKASLLGRAMATSQDFANYVCGPKLCNLYVVYLLRSMTRMWQSLMAGSTHKTVYMPMFENLQIPVPPMSEQRAIAAALRDVDELLGGLDRLIAKKRDLRQAAMQQFLTGLTRLPGFHGEWQVKTLGQIGRCFAGGTPSTARPDYWDGEVYWLPSGRIQNSILARPADAEITISQRGVDESAARQIRANAVLVAITGATCANVALLGFEATANQSVVAIEPDAETDHRFLFYALLLERGQILSLQGGSAQGGVNLRGVKASRFGVLGSMNKPPSPWSSPTWTPSWLP